MCRSRRSSRIASMRIISPSASSSYRSGWNSRSVWSNDRANVCATSRFPTPGGPWKRYAWAGPSRSAASSSLPASGCSEKRANVLTNLLRDLLRGTCTVDGHDPLTVAFRQRLVGLVDPAHERRPLPLDAVGAPRAAALRLVGVEQHEERADGQQPARHGQVQLQHLVLAEPARDALVGD